MLSREPGGTPLGQQVRQILLDGEDMDAWTEVFLFCADRHHHVETLIRPALNAGKWFISDRYVDSTLVYQGYGQRLSLSRLRAVCELAIDGLWPDLTLCIDLPAEQAISRQLERNRLGQLDLSFYERVREGFHREAELTPQRFEMLKGDAPAEEVLETAWQAVQDRRARLSALEHH